MLILGTTKSAFSKLLARLRADDLIRDDDVRFVGMRRPDGRFRVIPFYSWKLISLAGERSRSKVLLSLVRWIERVRTAEDVRRLDTASVHKLAALDS